MKYFIFVILLASCLMAEMSTDIIYVDSVKATTITVDSIASLTIPFGKLDRNAEAVNGDTLVCTVVDSYYVIEVVDSACCANAANKIIFNYADRSLTIPPGWSGAYDVTGFIALSCDHSSLVHIGWSKNGVVGNHAVSCNHVKSATEIFNIPIMNIAVNATAGDVFKFVIKTDNGGDKVVIRHFAFKMIWISP